MNEQGVYNVLTKLDVLNLETIGEWVMGSCPFAPYRHITGYDSTASFGVHVEDEDLSRYNCFTCKSKGVLSGLAFQLATLRDDPDLRALAQKLEKDEILGGTVDFGEWDAPSRKAKKEPSLRVTKFPSEREFTDRFRSVISDPNAIRYLQRRRISLDTAFTVGLRYDPIERRILFPVYDEFTGRFAGCSGRSIASTRWRERRALATGRKQPKVRDYFGLQKDRLLLGPKTYGRPGGAAANSQQLRPSAHQESGPLVVVEGLFAYARIRQIRPRVSVRALLGSAVTDGKAALLRVVDRPVYWLTDDDLAGQSCLKGVYDNVSGQHNPDDDPKKRGALDQFYGDFAQFTMVYPEGKTDPDDLTGSELDAMMENAELYIK